MPKKKKKDKEKKSLAVSNMPEQLERDENIVIVIEAHDKSVDKSLITIHISDCCQFSDIHISQGNVATYLRCGGIFKYDFVAHLPLSLPVKEL